jgi:hypothetical protein
MNDLHPALAFLHRIMPRAQAVGADTLRWDIDDGWVEICVAPANADPVFFAAGRTRLSYRHSAGLPDRTRDRLQLLLLKLNERLAAGRVSDPRDPLPAGGGWTDCVKGGDRRAWRDWVARSYRASVEAGRRDECSGLPECLDLRTRPPIQRQCVELAETPRTGPCSRCGRARRCPAAQDSDEGGLKPLRHADVGSAELAALRVLAEAFSVPLARALEAYTLLTDACVDRALDGATALEYSVRLPGSEGQPGRLRFVSYYPMATSDAARCEINRGRRAAVQRLAAQWLAPPEAALLDAWLACTTETQPATLGLSIGVEVDVTNLRLQVYAHPDPRDDADSFAKVAVRTLGGSPENIPTREDPLVLVGIALSTNKPPALKLYYQRQWEARGDTGLLPHGLGELAPFNPGWGLAVQEHVGGRADWVKWDFPVTTHYQVHERFLEAFCRTGASPHESLPGWLSGESFSPWPTWVSLGRGGRALYLQAR